MARPLNLERIRYFTDRAHEHLEAVKRELAPLEVAPPEDERPIGLAMRAADLRDSARLVAEFAQSSEPAILPEVQVRLVLDWVADRLGREGEAAAAEFLRDRDTRLEAMRRFCGEEPAGL
jgi:hypothetical protein